MIKRLRKHQTYSGVSPRTRALILPILIAIGATAVVLAILSIMFVPKINPGAQRGVGADGFQAYIEEGGDLGMGKIVSKSDVESVLGTKSKLVSNVETSKVMNLNGTRGQTATYDFVRADGKKSSVYIDVMIFKNQAALDTINPTQNTIKSSVIDGGQSYYMHAMTFSSNREYRLLIIKGLKVYKFVVVQPWRSLTITEVAALAAMKKLATKAEL